jgi:hypothetical protein
MSPSTEAKVEATAFLDDIERRVSEIFSAQKSEVEQTLVEKINREKEEAQRRIEAVNREFSQVRGILEEHKTGMAELQTTEQHLRGEIRGHFDRAVNYQKMMENAASLAGEELEKIGGLNLELEKVRVKAESEYASIRKSLAGYAGIVAQIPAPAVKVQGGMNWTEEIGKLRKVRDLLATLRQAGLPETSDASGDASDVEAKTSVPEAETAEELAASLGLIDAEFAEGHTASADLPCGPADTPEVPVATSGETFEFASGLTEEIPVELEPAAEAVAVAVAEAAVTEAAGPSPEDASVLESLARYRRTEPVNNGIELGFYSAETGTVLDAAQFMAAVGTVVENASQLHTQLTQTTSVKDLFLLKQEILNQQEILRKVFFRVVRFCDKEGGRLPEALSEIVSSQGMKDIIERLTMANWSDPSDFRPFLSELKAMKRAFETRVAASPSYLKSVLDAVEGREN